MKNFLLRIVPRRCLILITVGALALVFASAGAAQAPESDDFVVRVTSPARDGIEIGKGLVVKGTADLPAGFHLWVFARRFDFTDVWWPQNEARINPRTGEWKVYANFGGPQDVDWEFDVAVAVFDEDTHRVLEKYRKQAVKSGHWAPIEMPIPAVPPQLFVVNKVSDD